MFGDGFVSLLREIGVVGEEMVLIYSESRKFFGVRDGFDGDVLGFGGFGSVVSRFELWCC